MDAIYIDAIWLGIAFLSGLLMKRLGLPTLIGFLVSGFVLNYLDLVDGNLETIIDSLSSLGITLLLFTIGLKIKFKSLLQKEILITASAHMVLTILAFSSLVLLMSLTSIQFFADITLQSALAIGFALSFSSTVFVVKTLEDRGELSARHGKLAIGILIVQDVFAVVFITLTNDIVPSIWALGLPVYLYLIRFVLNPLLRIVGHGEMLTVFGFFAPLLLGSLAFDLVHVKYDLGALLIGMILVDHAKADELYERMMTFKDFFLIAFFISIGLKETPTALTVTIAFILLLLVFFKGYLFNFLMSFFNLRARTNFLTSLSLMNYSEFGLIVGAVAYDLNWISGDWIVIIALLMTFSFLLSAPLNARSYDLFDRFRQPLRLINRTSKDIDKQPKILDGIKYIVVGVGSIGYPAYLYLREQFGDSVMAVDYNNDKINRIKENGCIAEWGDSTDREFWDENNFEHIDLVILAMSDHASNYNTIKQINRINNRKFKVSVICHYDDEKDAYKKMAADYVFYYKKELGEDFAEHALDNLNG
jgi:predicted Kef-type K+ transport protein